MFISVYDLFFCILCILGAIALVLLIMVLIKLFKFLARVNGLIERNEKNMDKILISLPKATENFLELSDNLKAVGEVLTETTATAIETKEHIDDYMDVFVDILKIVKYLSDKKAEKNNSKNEDEVLVEDDKEIQAISKTKE